MKIKEIPVNERPREKALAYGIRRLSDQELLALLLQHGSKGQSALELAQVLLNKEGGLYALSSALGSELQVKGMGKAKILKLEAAFELGRRALEETSYGEVIADKAECCFLFGKSIAHDTLEHLKLISLDKKKRLLRAEEISSGSPDLVKGKKSALLKSALGVNASYVYLLHNHPSGNPCPSEADTVFYNDLCLAFRNIGIILLDSLIVAKNRFYSSKERKLYEYDQDLKK